MKGSNRLTWLDTKKQVRSGSKPGEVSGRSYLRTLLKEEKNRGKLEEDEYQTASTKPLVFHKPGDPPPMIE